MRSLPRACRGSVLMETVIVMPVLLLLIFGIIQTAMIWTGKQLTVYAAYCAARAITVVRAPSEESDGNGWKDKSDEQSATEQDDAARKAARLALAWICFYDSNEQDEIGNRVVIPGWGAIDQSGSIDKRIGVEILNRGTQDSDPYVSVRVTFAMSLMMPVMGVDVLMAKAAASDGSEIYSGSDFYGNLAKASRGAPRMYGLPYITFSEVCTIPMPYSTRNFPRGAYEDVYAP